MSGLPNLIKRVRKDINTKEQEEMCLRQWKIRMERGLYNEIERKMYPNLCQGTSRISYPLFNARPLGSGPSSMDLMPSTVHQCNVSWVGADDVQHSQELVDEFHQHFPDKPGPWQH